LAIAAFGHSIEALRQCSIETIEWPNAPISNHPMNAPIGNRQSSMDSFWLSPHLPYACRHSGACCTARWPIPIERDRVAAIEAAISRGQLTVPPEWYRPADDAPPEIAGVLALQPSGACVFHRDGCRIHPVRPASCRHFPYVCVLDPRGVHVTLSHFCPTAAGLLFDDTADVRVVAGPPIFADGEEPEGLDARDALPPLAPGTRHPLPSTRPQLLSWDAVTAWEHEVVATLAADVRTPDAPSLERFDRARLAVPSPWRWPEPPSEVTRGWHDLVAPEWPRWTRVIGRYLASKAHASWAMYLGTGSRDVEALIEISRSVVQVEAVRACRLRARPLDRSALIEAIRQADLLLLHHADPHRLCQPNREATS
jgi:Fe-S-cluster containining protein